MKAKSFYSKEQFSLKIKMTDDVWDDMDDEMLDKVTEFEKTLNENVWNNFVTFLNLPHSAFKKVN